MAGIDLVVPDGHMVVLLGPSGCGKTTTMRCIAGLETPDSGRIMIDGRPVFDSASGIDVAVNKRNVGMVFQSYAIWPHMTVFENVAFPLTMQGIGGTELQERTFEALEQVGLADYAKRGSSALSGGQMQRVALARSLVMRPAVLLFDEPLSNLDARLRDRLRVQLRELQVELKITGIYVTHDQQEALALADQIVVMEQGKILQIGDPVDIYQNPKSSHIAEFLGYSNIFPLASIEEADGLRRIEIREGGRRLVAAAGYSVPDGEDAAICVRPDDISIQHVADGSAPPESGNTFVGRVTLASFLGSHMLYRVRDDDDAVWEVLSKDISRDITVGSRAALTIHADAIKVLPVR